MPFISDEWLYSLFIILLAQQENIFLSNFMTKTGC